MNTFGAIKLGFSGNRVVFTGPTNIGDNIDLPYDPIDKRSLLLYRGVNKTLVDLDQYDILAGKLQLVTPLEIDEQLTVIYIGYDASARINFPATLGTDGKIKPEQISDAIKARPKNYFINSNFVINQRVGPFTQAYLANANAGGFTVDRWIVDSFGSTASNAIISQKVNNTASLLQYGYYSLRIQNNTSGTGSNWLKQRVEGSLSEFLGKPFTAAIRCVKDITDSATLSKTIGVECRVIYYPGGIVSQGNLTSGFQTVIPWTSIGTVGTTSNILSVSGTFPTVNTIQGAYTTSGLVAVEFKFQGPTNGGSYAILVQNSQFTMTSALQEYFPRSKEEEWQSCLRYYETTYVNGVAAGTVDNATRHAGVRVMAPNVYQTTHVFNSKKRIPPIITIWNPDVPNTTGTGCDASIGPSSQAAITASWITENDVALFCPAIQWNGTYRNSLVLYHLVADAEIY